MLSRRLETILDYLDLDDNIADIGSDHCLLPIAFARKGARGFIEAIDNKKGPYLAMEEAVLKAGLEKRIHLSLSDGLDCLDEKVDTLVIAGMGGRLSVEILNRGRGKLGKIKKIILDPHRDLLFLREAIVSLGYFIKDEKVVEEKGVYYFVTVLEKGKAPHYSPADLYFGPVARKKREKEFIAFLLEMRARLLALLKKDLSIEARAKAESQLRLIKEELANRN